MSAATFRWLRMFIKLYGELIPAKAVEKKVVSEKFLMQENNCDCREAIRVGGGEVHAAAKGNAFSAR